VFGQEFHKVGSGEFWWASHGPPMGVFGADRDLMRPDLPRNEPGPTVAPFFCVTDFEGAVARVNTLGGRTLERGQLGPYRACECRDDQWTTFFLWWDPNP
jgi:hypothetical protein